ncbi:kinase-like domain-containing protein, partial [Jimgerdemannia flammicorona]
MIAVKQVDIPKTKSDQLSQRQTDMVKSLYHEIDLLKITRTLSSTLVSRSLRLESPHFLLVILILTVFQFPEETVNIFLEYVPGGSIASCVHKFGPPPEPVIRNFTRQILLGLEYLHEQHILHRDIKGGNVLVDEDGVCKISDFGLSKKNDYDEAYDQNSRMSIQGSVFWWVSHYQSCTIAIDQLARYFSATDSVLINTLFWHCRMAPEVVRHEPYSAKIDIWSLGCLVLEMFTGDRPWISSDQWAAIYSLGHSQPPPIPDTLSPLAKDFLKKCFIM